MINAGTVGAYLELDISHFKHNLETAGKMLEQFRTQKESVFNDNGSPGTAVFDALTAPITAAGKAAAAFAGIFGREMGTVREDARNLPALRPRFPPPPKTTGTALSAPLTKRSARENFLRSERMPY